MSSVNISVEKNGLLDAYGIFNEKPFMGQLFSFIILLTSIFTFFFFGEIRNLTTFTRLMDYNNGLIISSFFLSLLSFIFQNGKILKVVS